MFLKITLIVLAVVIVLSAVVLLYLIAPRKAGKRFGFNIDQVKFAHRGYHNLKENVPENSLTAFKKALELGYGIELDIRETKDNQIVVFHDDSLKRMCGLDKLVEELTLVELKSLKLLNTSEEIPTLYKAHLPGSECLSLCEKADAILDNYDGNYCIESFNYRVLNWYKKNRPKILRGQLSMGMQCYEVALGKEEANKLPMLNRRMVTYLLGNFIGRPHFISYRYQDINFIVKLNKLLGAKIACWTVNEKSVGEKLLREYDSIIFEKYLA
jgi:glycerophosphoryl diester phosphodiesterase